MISTALYSRNTALKTKIRAFPVTCVAPSEFFNLYPTRSYETLIPDMDR